MFKDAGQAKANLSSPPLQGSRRVLQDALSFDFVDMADGGDGMLDSETDGTNFVPALMVCSWLCTQLN